MGDLGMKNVFLLLGALVLVACGRVGQDIDLPINAKVDDGFSYYEIRDLENTFYWARAFQAPRTGRSDVSRFYEDVFGSTSSSDLMNHIDERISYFVSPFTDHNENLLIATRARGEVLASNLGAAIFVQSLAQNLDLEYRFSSKDIPVRSTRVGLVKLNDAFFRFVFNDDSANNFLRMSLLIHEGRHSDCTGGMRRSEILNAQKGVDHVDNSCAHLHTFCPRGHDYEGYAACDNHEWGAYAISAVYAQRIAECSDCSEELIQAAKITAIDQASRVLVREKLFKGKLGLPDMSHSDRIVEDIR